MSISEALVKLPLLFVDTHLSQKACTPPNPPADPEEQQKCIKKLQIEGRGTRKEEFLTKHYRKIIYGLCGIYHAPTVCEIYLILAKAFPSIQIPSIIKFLTPFSSLSTVVDHFGITKTFIAGSAMIATGSLIRIACYRAMGRHFTFDLSLRNGHRLVTDGPYSIVRHPSYLGTVIYTLGHLAIQLGHGSWWLESGIAYTPEGQALAAIRAAAGLGVAGVLLSRVPREDRILRDEFKEEWETWARKTPYKVVPWIY
ncbi:hypothetical protein K474DRAFT_1667010 [Panus rudis PR-1116 ss-1]|nr:hypothetical protein K474DRAFT_1667010 [Panus rudis PR-1116 ss-1]